MKKFFVLMFCIILLVGTISAAEWDNKKFYDEKEQKITIRNSILGLIPTDKIMEVEVLTPTKNYAIIPSSPFVEMKITAYKDYDNPFKQMDFYEKVSMNKKNAPNFYFEYYDEDFKWSITKNEYAPCPETGKSCRAELIGTYEEERIGKWIVEDFDKIKFKKGEEVLIRGYYPELQEGEKIEWIPTIAGLEIDEWLDFTGATKYERLESTLDYANTIEENTPRRNGQVFNIGQTGANETFDAIGVSIATHDDTGDAGICNISIQALSGGDIALGQEIMSYGTFDGDGVPTPGWLNITLTSYSSLIKGASYGIVIMCPSGDASNYIRVDGPSDNNPYAVGHEWYWTGGAWAEKVAEDLNFVIWGTEPVAPAVVSVVFPVNNTVYAIDIDDLNYTVTDGESCWYSLNRGLTNSSHQVAGTNWSGLSYGPGWNNATVFCNNTANAVASDISSFFVNKSLSVSLNLPANLSNYSLNGVNFTVNSTPINSELGNATIYINNPDTSLYYSNLVTLSGTSPITSSWNLTGIPDGTYTWNAVSKAETFEKWDTNRTFTINTTPDIHYIAPTTANASLLTVSNFLMNVSITETYFSSLQFGLYDALHDPYASFNYTNTSRFINWSSIPDGEYYYNSTVWTTTGQLNSTETRGFTINTTPDIHFITPTTANASVLTTNNFLINVSLTEDYFSSLQFGLYDALHDPYESFNYTNSSRFINWSGMSDGEYYYNSTVWTTTGQLNSTETRGFTINTTPDIHFITPTPTNNTNFTTDSFVINVSVTEEYFGSVLFYLHDSTEALLNVTNLSGSSRFINYTSLADGNYSYNSTIWTTTGQKNSTATRILSIDSSSPTLNVSYPNETIPFHRRGMNITINWTVSDASGLANCSYSWVVGTNITVPCASNNVSLNITDGTNTNVTFYATDTFGHINAQTIEWDYKLFWDWETYDTEVIEGTLSTFSAGFLTNGSAITIADLYYNSTSNFGTITHNGNNNYTVTKSITAPFVTTTTNVSFYWNISQGSSSYSLDVKNQSITTLTVDDCNTNTNLLYNFTILDERTQVKINGSDRTSVGKIDLSIYPFASNTALLTFNMSYPSTNSFAICINNNLSTGGKYKIDALVEYGASDHVTEFYNIQNETIDSSDLNTNISLYSLNSTESQEFLLIIKDDSFLLLDDALVEVHRKYVEEGKFKVVEIQKTAGNGETIAHLVLEDVIYKFVVKKFGETILTFDDVYAYCQNPTLTRCVIDFNAVSQSITVPDYETLQDFIYTLDFNRTSRIITSQYNIPSGIPATIMLEVIREDALGTAVCTDSLTSDSGTLNCVVASSFGNTTVRANLYRDSEFIAWGNVNMENKPSEIYQGVLIFLALFIMLTLIGAGMSDNPVYTILFLMVGVILLFAMNILSTNGFLGGAATILWLIVAIVLVTIKGVKRN